MADSEGWNRKADQTKSPFVSRFFPCLSPHRRFQDSPYPPHPQKICCSLLFLLNHHLRPIPLAFERRWPSQTRLSQLLATVAESTLSSSFDLKYVPLSSTSDLSSSLHSFDSNSQATSPLPWFSSSTLPLLALTTLPRPRTYTRRTRLPPLLYSGFSRRWKTNFDGCMFGSRGSCECSCVITTLYG